MSKIEALVAALLATAGLMLIAYEMAARVFVPQWAVDWGQELTIFLIVWAMLLTGGILVRENAHIRVDLVLRVLTPRWLSAVEIFNCTVGVVFCTAMAWFGYEVVQFAIDFGERSETSLQIPMAFYFACLPVAMALMALRYVIRLFQMIRDFGAPTPIDEFHHLPSAD